MQISVETEGFQIASRFADIPQELEHVLSGWLVDMAMWMKEDLKSRVPVRTGNLRGSIQYHLTPGTGGGGSATFSSVWYGKLIDEGKPEPWTITAQGGKPMAFQIGGTTFFAWKVHHPGIKPLDFTLQTLEASEGKADQLAEEAANQIWGWVMS